MLEVLAEENHKRCKSNRIAAGMRFKAKSNPLKNLTFSKFIALDQKKPSETPIRPGRLTADFCSPFRSKSPCNIYHHLPLSLPLFSG